LYKRINVDILRLAWFQGFPSLQMVGMGVTMAMACESD